MATYPCVQCRVSEQTKSRFGLMAQQRQLTESALLKWLVEMAVLNTAGLPESSAAESVEQVARDSRLSLRLRPEDHLLLRERAGGRGMAAATYASYLLRAHLRALSPLPQRELAELKRSVAALGMIGRNLNQLARVANQMGRVAGPSATDLRALLRALEALRDHVKELVKANTASWEKGHA